MMDRNKEASIMRNRIEVDNYFGGCPTCGRTNGYLNARWNHWFVCEEHRVRWYAGSNLFSSWKDETEDEQREAWAKVEDYSDVSGKQLPEGNWPSDPEDRAKELADHREKIWNWPMGTPASPRARRGSDETETQTGSR